MNIAILGATGHLARCARHILEHQGGHALYLFSRQEGFMPYSRFREQRYDLIFNGVGCWDTPGVPPRDIFAVTERFDGLILDYQLSHPGTRAIHISSGAVYGGDFAEPVNASTPARVPVNALSAGDLYTAAKLSSEAKHRAFPELPIVDLRLFGFFSRFMALDRPYYLSALINAVKTGTTFRSVPGEFWRDYVSLADFAALLGAIAGGAPVNAAVDVRSAAPVSNRELIALFQREYGLNAAFDDAVPLSRTGNKPRYYSTAENPFYTPTATSLETVRGELKFFLE